jgi:hypothetical protein
MTSEVARNPSPDRLEQFLKTQHAVSETVHIPKSHARRVRTAENPNVLSTNSVCPKLALANVQGRSVHQSKASDSNPRDGMDCMKGLPKFDWINDELASAPLMAGVRLRNTHLHSL